MVPALESRDTLLDSKLDFAPASVWDSTSIISREVSCAPSLISTAVSYQL